MRFSALCLLRQWLEPLTGSNYSNWHQDAAAAAIKPPADTDDIDDSDDITDIKTLVTIATQV